MSRAKAVALFWTRSALYKTSVGVLVQRVAHGLGHQPVHERNAQAYWDQELSGSRASYLGNFSVGCRDTLTLTLVSTLARGAQSLLDVGCAAGSLARAIAPGTLRRYVGVDISTVAIRKAAESWAGGPELRTCNAEFLVSDLAGYQPPADTHYDAIVFNEVLYYVELEQVAGAVQRYAEMLSPTGILVVSMKNDPKSHVIMRRLVREYRWLGGVLFQEKPEHPGFQTAINREYPAFLIGALGRAGV